MNNFDKQTSKYQKRDLDHLLKSEYATAIKDPNFKRLVSSLNIKENIAYKYTSKLERTVCELANCSKCKSLQNGGSGYEAYCNRRKSLILENLRKGTKIRWQARNSLRFA